MRVAEIVGETDRQAQTKRRTLVEKRPRFARSKNFLILDRSNCLGGNPASYYAIPKLRPLQIIYYVKIKSKNLVLMKNLFNLRNKPKNGLEYAIWYWKR